MHNTGFIFWCQKICCVNILSLTVGQEHVPAFHDIIFLEFVLEPLIDLVLGLGTFYHIQPVTAGACCLLRSNDLDDIAVAELIIKRYDTSVYLSADTAVADIRMDTVRKIDRHSAYRQINNVAARRKYKHLIGKNIHLYRIHEITGIAHILMPFQQLTQP